MSMDGVDDDALADQPPRPVLVYPLGDAPEPGKTKEIAPGVHWVRMPLPMVLRFINLWLIEDGDGWTLVDTGLALEETRNYWREIFATTMGGRPIKRVICTHMHPDHAGLAGWITRKFDARLHMSRLEYITCRMLVADTGRDAPDVGVKFYHAAGWDDEAIESYQNKFGGFGKLFSRAPDTYKRLTHGDELEIGGRPWRVVVGNGHSPEHVCLWQEELKLFISGDQVLPRISSNVSVFPTEPEGDPLSDWINSCARLRDTLPNDLLVLPAHNEPFKGLHERLNNLIEGHERSLNRLEKRIRQQPRRAIDMFGALFARKIDGDLVGMATGEAIAHANCLITRGRVRRAPDATGVIYYEPA